MIILEDRPGASTQASPPPCVINWQCAAGLQAAIDADIGPCRFKQDAESGGAPGFVSA